MEEENLIEKAREIAFEYHKDQLYGNRPYMDHLDHVAGVCKRFGKGTNRRLMAACYLHDILEDTPMTHQELGKLVGGDVANIVFGVTDTPRKDKEFTFKNRTRYNNFAINVKYYDRIANVEACLCEDKTAILEKYLKEFPLFKHILNGETTAPKEHAYLKKLMDVTFELIYERLL